VVTLSGRIGIDGYMTDVRSLDADVHPGLIAAATYAVERWEYEPTRLNGVPVDAGMRVTVRFDLR
jgi:TonB family protein